MVGYLILLFASPYIVYKILDFNKFYKRKQPNLHGNTISQCHMGDELCKNIKVDSTGEVSFPGMHIGSALGSTRQGMYSESQRQASLATAMGRRSFKGTTVSCRVNSCIKK